MPIEISGRSYSGEQEMKRRVEELDREHAGEAMPDEARSEWNALNKAIDEFEARRTRIRELATSPRNTEAGAAFHNPVESRDSGLHTIERYRNQEALTSKAADRLDELVRKSDTTGVDGRYLAAVGDPHYNSAFGKLLADPVLGHNRMTKEEVAAVQKVNAVEAERAMSIGTTTAGGFAVPFTLDPSVMLTSSGALNPIRELSREITIATDTWKGVSSTGVTASYVAEATAATDASPTLAQPTIDCAQGRAFVPFSIELGQDWDSLQQELVRLISDGRDVLDATQFLTGTGTDSPAGVLTGLTTSQRVQTVGTAAIAISDIYSLKGALPARFIPNATFAAHPNRLDSIFRLTPSGSTTEPQAMPTRDGALVGKPVVEWTTMATTSSSGSKYALYGGSMPIRRRKWAAWRGVAWPIRTSGTRAASKSERARCNCTAWSRQCVQP